MNVILQKDLPVFHDVLTLCSRLSLHSSKGLTSVSSSLSLTLTQSSETQKQEADESEGQTKNRGCITPPLYRMKVR